MFRRDVSQRALLNLRLNAEFCELLAPRDMLFTKYPAVVFVPFALEEALHDPSLDGLRGAAHAPRELCYEHRPTFSLVPLVPPLGRSDMLRTERVGG